MRHTITTTAAAAALLSALLATGPVWSAPSSTDSTRGAVAAAPQQCPAGGVKVNAAPNPTTVSVTDSTTGTAVTVRVTITGTEFTITATDANTDLTTASWCLKAGTKTQSGSGTSGESTITNSQGVPQEISYLVVYSVTTPSPGACWDGESGLNDFQYDGPIDTRDNAFQTFSQDGTCTGGQIGGLRTIVQAPDQDTARAKCSSVSGFPNAVNMRNVFGGDPPVGFPAAPADYWSCF